MSGTPKDRWVDVGEMDERDVDMLIERALVGLDAEDERSLAGRLDESCALDRFDGAVAAVAVAMHQDSEPMPEEMAMKVRALGRGFAAARSAERASDAEPRTPSLKLAGTGAPVRGRIGVVGMVGWLAAAACLVVALVIARPTPEPGAEVRLAELERSPDVIHAGWAGLSAIGAANHPLDRGVQGEVVWSDSENEGFMRISGIEPNDPQEFQYQLWIFDSTRPVGDLPGFRAEGLPEILTQRPVDGGVFDVTDAGGVLVPIEAKLPVGEGVIFAVTKERPGGVVVSDREIVFLALRS